jgi:8-oxo-dGTP diphosphatase
MYQYQYPHPAITADAVIFTLREAQLHALMIKRGQEPHKGYWAFPGGFVDIDEDIDDAAHRELQEETGLTGMPLRQFHTFGTPGRDPRERVITVAYLALVPADDLRPVAGDDAADVRWFSLGAAPPLASDHDQILAIAHACLVRDMYASDDAARFLPREFSLAQVHHVFEVVHGHAIDATRLRAILCGLHKIEAVSNGQSAGEMYRWLLPTSS